MITNILFIFRSDLHLGLEVTQRNEKLIFGEKYNFKFPSLLIMNILLVLQSDLHLGLEVTQRDDTFF